MCTNAFRSPPPPLRRESSGHYIDDEEEAASPPRSDIAYLHQQQSQQQQHQQRPEATPQPQVVTITQLFHTTGWTNSFFFLQSIHRCRLCYYEGRSAIFLKNHIRTAHLDEVHTIACPFCEYTTDSRYQIGHVSL